MKYYLAYGSNLDTASFYKRCPNAKLVTTATMEGYKLSFKRLNELSNTYLTIEKDESSPIINDKNTNNLKDIEPQENKTKSVEKTSNNKSIKRVILIYSDNTFEDFIK